MTKEADTQAGGRFKDGGLEGPGTQVNVRVLEEGRPVTVPQACVELPLALEGLPSYLRGHNGSCGGGSTTTTVMAGQSGERCKCEGQFHGGLFDGEGELTVFKLFGTSEGYQGEKFLSRYKGQFVGGKMHGKGVLAKVRKDPITVEYDKGQRVRQSKPRALEAFPTPGAELPASFPPADLQTNKTCSGFWTCKCGHGDAAQGPACPGDDVEKCVSCDSGFRLENGLCLEYVCECEFGRPLVGAGEPVCEEHGKQACYPTGCDESYKYDEKTGICI